MQIKIYRIIVCFLLLLWPLASWAQKNNSLNAFSPYTFYGIGEILPVGTAATRSMGGIGVAYSTPFEVNLVNPAAYSAAWQRSAALTVGLSGRSSFLKTNDSKTANNSFSVNDFGLMLPISKRIGFAISVTPYSSVGYETEIEQHKQPGEDPNLIVDVGHIMHTYYGDGNINQIKAGFGMEVFKDFSLGVNFIAYLGTINRYTYTTITSVNAIEYNNVSTTRKEEVGDVSFEVGMQYRIVNTAKRMFSIGATYQPEVTLRNKMIHNISTYDPSNSMSSSVLDTAWRQKMKLPQKFTGGVYYRTAKFGAGLDYTYQDWTNAYHVPEKDMVTLRESHTIGAGVHYTPNAMDIRRFLNRWTYRAGFRYSTLSVVKDGYKMDEMALTFGLGIPLRSGSHSEMSIGFELGRRGRKGVTKNGYQKVRDDFYRVSVGFSLFDNTWFMKYKYD